MATRKKRVRFDYKTLAAKIYPGWENEPVFSLKSMRGYERDYKGSTHVELVKIAGQDAGLVSSDMAQEFGGTLGR